MEITQPNDAGLERTVLALSFYGHADMVFSQVSASSFYTKQFFDAYLILYQAWGRGVKLTPTDFVLADDLQVEITNYYPGSSNPQWYIDNLLALDHKRRIIKASARAIEAAKDEESDAHQISTELAQEIVGSESGGLIHIRETLGESVTDLEKFVLHNTPQFFSQIKAIDKLVSGFEPGDLIYLAGRPSSGKTTLALNMALLNAELGLPVYIFEIEMLPYKLNRRNVSYYSNLSIPMLKSGSLSKDEFLRVKAAYTKIETLPIYINSHWYMTPAKMRAALKPKIAQHGKGIIILDYIQCLKPDEKNQNRVVEVGKMSAALMGIAKETECPLIALSQLSRDIEHGDGRKPRLSDLRDSGCLEQDARIVMVLDKPEKEQPEITLYVLKNGDGATGEVNLIYKKDVNRFESPMTWRGTSNSGTDARNQ